MPLHNDKRGVLIDSWMRNGFYALLFKKTSVLRPVVYNWTVHIYAPPFSSTEPTATVHGQEGGHVADPWGAHRRMGDVLRAHGHRVILLSEGKVVPTPAAVSAARHGRVEAEVVKKVADSFPKPPAPPEPKPASLPLFVAEEDIRMGDAVVVNIDNLHVSKAIKKPVEFVPPKNFVADFVLPRGRIHFPFSGGPYPVQSNTVAKDEPTIVTVETAKKAVRDYRAKFPDANSLFYDFMWPPGTGKTLKPRTPVPDREDVLDLAKEYAKLRGRPQALDIIKLYSGGLGFAAVPSYKMAGLRNHLLRSIRFAEARLAHKANGKPVVRHRPRQKGDGQPWVLIHNHKVLVRAATQDLAIAAGRNGADYSK